jgi:hypothetical protein
MVPVLPNAGNTAAVLKYQNLLASTTAGGATRPPFISSWSSAKMTMDDYYSQMMVNHLERQELKDMEREHRRVE